MKERLIGAGLALVMLFSVVAMPARVLAASTSVKEITILHTNDIHGRAEENEKNGEIGYAKLKTYANSIPNSILIDAGDVVHGTTFATISRGESMINLMNDMGYVAMTPGNHDFNYGYDRLKELAGKANFPILAANVITNAGQQELAPNKIIEVNGVKLGIFGLATDETKTKSNPLNTEGVMFLNNVDVAKEQVAKLKAQGAEIIVANVHLGLDESSVNKSSDLAKAVDGIDLIIDGHSHTALPSGKMVNNTLIVQTGGQFSQVGEVKLQVADGKLVTASASLHDYNFFKNVSPDAKILAAIEAIQSANKPYLDKVIGQSAVDLEGLRDKVRTGETNLGNLLTDAMRQVAAADIAITNGGGIRASIEKGDITMGEILTAFPFTNYPVKLEVTGKTVLEALEFGVDKAPESAGKFPHVSGITFKYDPKQAPGQRVFDVKVAGADLDLNKTYTLVTNDFMAVGGDGYEMFKSAKKLSEYPLLSEVLAKYIEKAKIVNPSVEGRITVAEKAGQAPASKFTDISGNWAEKYILDVVAKGYFTGTSATTFEPNTKISRAMVVATLARLEGQDKAQTVSKIFSDVEAGKWFTNGVAWAANNKIVAGYEDGSFRPNQEVTREEMAAIIGRYIEFKKLPVTNQLPADFADQDKIGEWARGPIIAVRNTGIMAGKPGNLFDPKGQATRGELAKVIYELSQLVKKAGPAEKVAPVEKAPTAASTEKPAA